MKNLILINGTMGAGKTAASRELQKLLPHCVFLDGDWCWDMSPFIVTDETKKMVLDNIAYLLNSFLSCSIYENIIFCWVMHEQSIIDKVLSRLVGNKYRPFLFSVVCSPEALTARIQNDIQYGRRTADVLSRSLQRLPHYKDMNTVKIDVSDITPKQAAEEIYQRVYGSNKNN
ncbi:MAG: AAA family ATPase [Clostridiales bacterium]|nr:AAA family ATPase [Clostridiales bacterium]